MKKIISGISLMFFGIILFGIVYLPSSNYMVKLGQWYTPPGKFMTSVIETGGFIPLVIGICLFIGYIKAGYGCMYCHIIFKVFNENKRKDLDLVYHFY